MMADTKYCLCCGENVPYNHVERNERRELTCTYCGFTLDVQTLWDPSMASEGHVLVAEDSKYVRNIIVEALKATKFSAHVLAVENGLELTTSFAKLVSEHAAIDLAIIDLNMPIMDGLKLVSLMKSNPLYRDIPVVIISTEGAVEDRERGMALGARAYLPKPIQTNNLLKTVRELLNL